MLIRILFICTHNRCRSILAEAIANHFGEGLIVAASAGSQPVSEVHPLTLKYLSEHQIPVTNLKSQSWSELENFKPDLVVTVCNSAAEESCPAWFDNTYQLHWDLVDPSKPSKIRNNTKDVAAAFAKTITILTQGILQVRTHLEAGKSLNQIKDLIPKPG